MASVPACGMLSLLVHLANVYSRFRIQPRLLHHNAPFDLLLSLSGAGLSLLGAHSAFWSLLPLPRALCPCLELHALCPCP